MRKSVNEARKTKMLQFNTDDSPQMSALSFLDTSCGRKQSLLIAHAVNEFVEKYHLRGKSIEEVRQFLQNFNVISSTVNDVMISFPPNYGITSQDSPAPNEVNSAEEQEKALSDELNDIAAMFNIA